MSSKNTCSGTTRAPSLTPNLDAQGQLQIPEEFPFPFKPYNVQQDFMKCLFSTIENGGMGVFESPTGTGKSMSMICGALAWLKANREREDSRRPAGTARGTDDNSQKIVDAKTMERTPEITHVESVDSSSQDGLGSNTRKEDPDAPDWVKQYRHTRGNTVDYCSDVMRTCLCLLPATSTARITWNDSSPAQNTATW
eukprot:m.251555 g.251555  ORF g.251555 m.251555 type:complete len:196 (-) comp19540_c0_seq5:2788-3375(-)